MKIIKKADSGIFAVCGSGKINTFSEYRLMTYVVTEASDDGLLIFNAITGELAVVSAEEGKLLDSLPCSYSEWMNPFIEKRFLVPVSSCDNIFAENLRTALRLLNKFGGITTFTISPTTACNARCFYCFESGWKTQTMSEKTADDVVTFIKKSCKGKHVSIAWFGGEPLIGADRITQICGGLADTGVEFSSKMTSNGYLFCDGLIKTAKEQWNLQSVMITLDGTETVYNQTKAYINSSGNPYRRVLKNICALLREKIYVTVRLNIGMHNCDDLTDLINELNDKCEDKDYLSVYVRQLYDNCGTVPTDFEAKDNILLEKQNQLEGLLREFGLLKRECLPKLKLYHCKADFDNAVIIHPTGKLSKCEHNHDSGFIGDVIDGITDYEGFKSSKRYVIGKACIDCPLYPTCLSLENCDVEERCTSKLQGLRLDNIKNRMKKENEMFRQNAE